MTKQMAKQISANRMVWDQFILSSSIRKATNNPVRNTVIKREDLNANL
jgi:hypothetical protein